MKNITVVEVPILNEEYWVYVVWGEIAKVVKYMQKHFEDVYIEEPEFENYRGRTWHRVHFNPVIHMHLEPGDKHFWGTLAHEATHAVDYIWETIGETHYGEAYSHGVGAVVHAVEAHLIKYAHSSGKAKKAKVISNN